MVCHIGHSFFLSFFLHFCCSLGSFCVAPFCGSLLATPFLMVLLGGYWWSLCRAPSVWWYKSFCMPYSVWLLVVLFSCWQWSFFVTMVLSSCSLWPFCVVTFADRSCWALWSCCLAPYGPSGWLLTFLFFLLI